MSWRYNLRSNHEIEKELSLHKHPRYIVIKDEKYLNWIRQLPCIVCDKKGPSDPNHIWNTGGGGGKYQDHLALPFCRPCHTEYHHLGHEPFEKRKGLSFELEIMKCLSFYIEKKEIESDN